MYEYTNNDLEPIQEEIKRRVVKSPFSIAKTNRAYNVVREVKTKVGTTIAFKSNTSWGRKEKESLKAYMPEHRKSKRHFNWGNPKNLLVSQENSMDSNQVLSKEVQLKGADFSIEFLPANNSPYSQKFKQVLAFKPDLSYFHVSHKGCLAVQHQAHPGEVHRSRF